MAYAFSNCIIHVPIAVMLMITIFTCNQSNSATGRPRSLVLELHVSAIAIGWLIIELPTKYYKTNKSRKLSRPRTLLYSGGRASQIIYSNWEAGWGTTWELRFSYKIRCTVCFLPRYGKVSTWKKRFSVDRNTCWGLQGTSSFVGFSMKRWLLGREEGKGITDSPSIASTLIVQFVPQSHCHCF